MTEDLNEKGKIDILNEILMDLIFINGQES